MSSFTFPNPKINLYGFATGALAVFLFSAFYTVPAESEGVILRFGKYIDKVQPGLHLKLPFVDEVIKVPTQRQLKLEFGLATPGATNPDQVGSEPNAAKAMVTGDLNAAEVQWVVQYRILEPETYLFEVKDPGLTVPKNVINRGHRRF